MGQVARVLLFFLSGLLICMLKPTESKSSVCVAGSNAPRNVTLPPVSLSNSS